MTLRVGLTMRIAPAATYDEPRDAIAHDWLAFLLHVLPGAVPVLIPNTHPDPRGLVAELGVEALILTGGADPGTSVRDRTETALMSLVLDHRLPTLAVCRGMQMLNRHLGGNLSRVGDDTHVRAATPVAFIGPWSAIGPTSVPCFHEAAIELDDLAAELTATAVDTDGRVEAAVLDTRATAIMWHPERRATVDATDASIIRHALTGTDEP